MAALMGDFKAKLKDSVLDLCGTVFPNMYRTPGGMLFPCGHAVAEEAPLHVKHLTSVLSPERFRTDLDFLCQKLHPLELSELERLAPKQLAPKQLAPKQLAYSSPRNFVLSFDDGLREGYEVIAPMLSRKGIPAIFFINSATIDNKRLLWRHKISLLIERSRQQPGRTPPQMQLGPNETLPGKLRALKFADEGLIDEIAGFLEVDFDDYLRTVKPYLTTNQIMELSRAGFAVGAHSDSHPYFQQMSVEDQKNQVSTCVRFIEKLGVSCRYFAFPFHDNDIPMAVFNHLRDLGLVLSFGTSEARLDSVGFSFQRFAIDVPGSGMPEILKRLSAKSVLRRLSRTELIVRNS
jgi:peptidoglycan/xylan/chitin deacetylase (PgdA/CDA1 family)